ncbi:MAG: hypothetical protein RLZZ488_429 [Pseudomonadota bacterium]
MRANFRESRGKLRQHALREGAGWGSIQLQRTLDFLADRRITSKTSARTIASYWPIDSELCLLPGVANRNATQNKSAGQPVAYEGTISWQLPLTLPSKELSWFELSPEVETWPRDRNGLPLTPADVSTGRFAEHQPAPWIVLVPCLAVDRDGYRLGYGGGYYDRFLEKHAANCLTIACVPDELLLEAGKIPVESHDRPVDLIVSERRLFEPRREQLLEKINLFNC